MFRFAFSFSFCLRFPCAILVFLNSNFHTWEQLLLSYAVSLFSLFFFLLWYFVLKLLILSLSLLMIRYHSLSFAPPLSLLWLSSLFSASFLAPHLLILSLYQKEKINNDQVNCASFLSSITHHLLHRVLLSLFPLFLQLLILSSRTIKF